MSRWRDANLWFWLSLLAALALALMPLPELLRGTKPFWLGLVVCFWVLEDAERLSLGGAFLVGLGADLFTAGTLLGEQAMRLTVMVFIVLRLRSRLRFFPMPQQILAIIALQANDRLVISVIRLFAGLGPLPSQAWFGPLVAGAVWPWLFLAFDRLRQRPRPRES